MQEQMADPAISGDHLKFQEVAQKAAEIQPAAEGYAAYKELEQQLSDTEAMLKDCAGDCRVYTFKWQSEPLRVAARKRVVRPPLHACQAVQFLSMPLDCSPL